MGSIPNIIEAALVLLVIFLIGCIIGWILRSKIFKRRAAPAQMTSTNEDTDKPLPSSSKPETIQAVTTPSVPSPKSDPVLKTVSETIKPPVAQKSESAVPAVAAPAKAKVSTAKPRKAKISVVASQKAKTSKNSTSKQDKVPQSSTTLSPNSTDSNKPSALSGPREGKKDDLKKIKGVGPKLESTLNELGIYHFDQIAKWTRQEIDWVDDFLSFKGRIDRDDWIAQAKNMS